MAIVLRVGKKTEPVKPARATRPVPAKVTLTLPDGPEDPVDSISKVTFLIAGENKVGKTSLCSMFPDPFFLLFEPGGKGLRIQRRECYDWKTFVKYIDMILASGRFQTIIIDPIALAYKCCVDHICSLEAVKDPGEVEWGKGWKAIEDEFIRQIRRLTMTDRGVIFLAHPETAEFEKRTGGKYNRLVPRMMKQARNFIEGFVDVIAFYGYFGNDRYFTIEGSDELNAGNRLKYRFRTVDGERIHSIPMFDHEDRTFDEEGAYRHLMRAFNNKQEDRCEPGRDAVLTETKAIRLKKRS